MATFEAQFERKITTTEQVSVTVNAETEEAAAELAKASVELATSSEPGTEDLAWRTTDLENVGPAELVEVKLKAFDPAETSVL